MYSSALTDAGPIVALIDRDEANHLRCVIALEQVTLPLVTTWPAFTEAMYLLGAAASWTGQEKIWRLVSRGDLQIVDISSSGLARMRVLMET